MSHRIEVVREVFAALVVAVIGVLVFTGSLARAGGPSGCGIEGPAADPPGFLNCATCHFPAAVNSGDGVVRFEGMPVEWSPGTTYRVNVALSDPGQQLWGFKATVLGSDGANAGVLAPADANSRLCSIGSKCYLSQSQRFQGTLDGPVRWAFDWTAPPAGVGRVVAFATGIACNADGQEGGDFTYTTSAASVESAAPGTRVTAVLQPDSVSLTSGVGEFVARLRVTNHDASPRSVFVATRVDLPSGAHYPREGFLSDPQLVQLGPNADALLTFRHAVPVVGHSVSAVYRAFVGAGPAQPLASDGVTVTIARP